MNKYNKKQDLKSFVTEKKKKELPKGLRVDTTTGEGSNIIRIKKAEGGRIEYSKGTMPARNKKNFRPTEKGAGMTRAGVAAYRRANPGSKLKNLTEDHTKYPH